MNAAITVLATGYSPHPFLPDGAHYLAYDTGDGDWSLFRYLGGSSDEVVVSWMGEVLASSTNTSSAPWSSVPELTKRSNFYHVRTPEMIDALVMIARHNGQRGWQRACHRLVNQHCTVG